MRRGAKRDWFYFSMVLMLLLGILTSAAVLIWCVWHLLRLTFTH